MKTAIKKYASKASAATALVLVTAGHAMAQENPPAAGTDLGIAAINELKSTGSLYIAAAFGVAVLVAAGFWGISMMKKSFGAAK